jgi:hypothetical protein
VGRAMPDTPYAQDMASELDAPNPKDVIGTGRWEAIAQIAAAFDTDLPLAEWATLLKRKPRGDTLVAMPGAIGKHLPDFANGILNAAMANGSLVPWSLEISMGIDPRMRSWVTHLDPDLTAEGHLVLAGSRIRELPQGLRTHGAICLNDCKYWDGIVPPDTRIGNLLFTDVHRYGIGLEAWREAHRDDTEREPEPVGPKQCQR